MNRHGAQISVAIVCIVLGILVSMQFRTAYDYDSSVRATRVEDLATKLSTVSAERDVLAKEVIDLRAAISSPTSSDPSIAGLQEELLRVSKLAGLTPLSGPGIVVTLDDSKRIPQAGEDPQNLLVHDTDLLMIVNELKASGAEAISINGERIIGMSEIRCAGTTILVNSNKIGAPFVITALGDPGKLESGINIKGGYMESIKIYGLQSQVSKSDHLEVPGYTGAFRMEEAQ